MKNNKNHKKQTLITDLFICEFLLINISITTMLANLLR